MGSTVVRGETEGTVEFTGVDTFFGKTASLLSGPSEMSNMQRMLVRIVLYLVGLSVLLCTIVLIYVSMIVPFTEALSFVVVLLVASVPMAIEIVTTTTLALGSKELSARGAIVTRLAAIEDMASMAILCSDKTGTLTLNEMTIQDHSPVYASEQTQNTLLRYAAMAAKWKEPPRDALDKLTLTAADLGSLEHIEQLYYMPFDPIVKRTEGTLLDRTTNVQFKVTKGAPHVLVELCRSSGGITSDQMRAVEKDVWELGGRGIRCMAVARTADRVVDVSVSPNVLPSRASLALGMTDCDSAVESGDVWTMLGLLTFLDPPRPDSRHTIELARKYGVAVKMITGGQYYFWHST